MASERAECVLFGTLVPPVGTERVLSGCAVGQPALTRRRTAASTVAVFKIMVTQ